MAWKEHIRLDPRWADSAELEGTNSREQYSESSEMGQIIKDTWELDTADWGHPSRMPRRWRESDERRRVQFEQAGIRGSSTSVKTGGAS